LKVQDIQREILHLKIAVDGPEAGEKGSERKEEM